MVDKVQKIREEVVRLQKRAEYIFNISLTENERQFWLGESNVLTLIGNYIDSMLEDPKKCMYTKDNYTDEDRKVLCDGCEEECKMGIKSKHATGKLKECIDNITDESLAKARKQLQEELVNGGLDLGCGVIWKDEKSVSEDLEEAVNAYIGYAPEVDESSSTYGKRQAFKAGANWQEQKDESKVLTEEQCRKIRDDAFELGKDAMKQQLMAKAVDAVVKVDAGGYPYIDRTIELYDYDKDIPLAKKGDKYKVILIKE